MSFYCLGLKTSSFHQKAYLTNCGMEFERCVFTRDEGSNKRHHQLKLGWDPVFGA